MTPIKEDIMKSELESIILRWNYKSKQLMLNAASLEKSMEK